MATLVKHKPVKFFLKFSEANQLELPVLIDSNCSY